MKVGDRTLNDQDLVDLAGALEAVVYAISPAVEHPRKAREQEALIGKVNGVASCYEASYVLERVSEVLNTLDGCNPLRSREMIRWMTELDVMSKPIYTTRQHRSLRVVHIDYETARAIKDKVDAEMP